MQGRYLQVSEGIMQVSVLQIPAGTMEVERPVDALDLCRDSKRPCNEIARIFGHNQAKIVPLFGTIQTCLYTNNSSLLSVHLGKKTNLDTRQKITLQYYCK